MKYCVEIEERLSRVVIVESDSCQHAIDYVRDKIDHGTLVLGGEDYIDCDYYVWEATPENSYYYEEI